MSSYDKHDTLCIPTKLINVMNPRGRVFRARDSKVKRKYKLCRHRGITRKYIGSLKKKLILHWRKVSHGWFSSICSSSLEGAYQLKTVIAMMQPSPIWSFSRIPIYFHMKPLSVYVMDLSRDDLISISIIKQETHWHRWGEIWNILCIIYYYYIVSTFLFRYLLNVRDP